MNLQTLKKIATTKYQGVSFILWEIKRKI